MCVWVQHVLYTEPAQPVAGDQCTVYYNPKNTNLDFADEVWMRTSFNRWTHEAPLAPIRMKATGGDHCVATFTVPKDAHLVDMVFSRCVCEHRVQ
jgi:hypothetical protein